MGARGRQSVRARRHRNRRWIVPPRPRIGTGPDLRLGHPDRRSGQQGQSPADRPLTFTVTSSASTRRIYSPSGGSVGIAFAIPAETERRYPAARKGSVTLRRADPTGDSGHRLVLKQATGALVAEPQANSPAVKAGIQSGDVITSVNGKPVRDARQLARLIGTMSPGTSVTLDLIHNGQQKTVTLTLVLPNEKEAVGPGAKIKAPTSMSRNSASRWRPPTRSPRTPRCCCHRDRRGRCCRRSWPAKAMLILDVGAASRSRPRLT